jgi:hypothetical protein
VTSHANLTAVTSWVPSLPITNGKSVSLKLIGKKPFTLISKLCSDRDELVEAVMSVGGPFMEDEQWGDMTNLEHMTLETIPSRFEVFLIHFHVFLFQ